MKGLEAQLSVAPRSDGKWLCQNACTFRYTDRASSQVLFTPGEIAVLGYTGQVVVLWIVAVAECRRTVLQPQ